MLKAEDIKAERWEGQDFIITGLHHHGGVFSKHEAEIIKRFIEGALPVIQLDAMKEGMRRASCKCVDCGAAVDGVKQAILSAAEQLTEKDLWPANPSSPHGRRNYYE